MSDDVAPAPEPIADQTVLEDPLATAEALRSEPRVVDFDNLVAAFVATSDMVLQIAEYEDRAAFDGRTSNTIGAPGSVAYARKIHERWQAERAELAEAEMAEAERINLDARLSDLGRAESREALGKRFAESRAKQLGQLEAAIDEVLAGREAACRRLVMGEAARDERSPELRALDRVAEGARLQTFMAATAGLDPKAFADAVRARLQAGDPATPDLLELARHRLWSTAPEHAMVLAAQARGAARERAMAQLKADPRRSAAVGEIALLRRVKDRIANERRWYSQRPHEPMPKVESTRG